MAGKQPNIVVFFWDNFGWGELGCYGGGVLRGARTPRIDRLAGEGLKLLNFNVEAQCTPSRSAILTGRHPIRSGTQNLALMGPDGMTRWEVTTAQALSDAGYATGMWGKWHLGSDPEQRSPVDFGFDEAVWCPRTADEVLWTMQSYFPNGTVSSAPYAGKTTLPLGYEQIYARKKGENHEVIATYDAEFRAAFDRKITGWAIDFMRRTHQEGKPFYMYLPYTQTHNPMLPDPEYAGKTKHGNFADVLTQMDDFTGQILDELDTLGLADDTIVVWASDNGPDSTYRYPVGDPDPLGGQWEGFGGPWRGSLFTALEGSLRTPCIIRWPGKVPAGKDSDELVHEVDLFTTLVLARGGTVPSDRQIDGMDMRAFLLGDAEESGAPQLKQQVRITLIRPDRLHEDRAAISGLGEKRGGPPRVHVGGAHGHHVDAGPPQRLLHPRRGHPAARSARHHVDQRAHRPPQREPARHIKREVGTDEHPGQADGQREHPDHPTPAPGQERHRGGRERERDRRVPRRKPQPMRRRAAHDHIAQQGGGPPPAHQVLQPESRVISHQPRGQQLDGEPEPAQQCRQRGNAEDRPQRPQLHHQPQRPIQPRGKRIHHVEQTGFDPRNRLRRSDHRAHSDQNRAQRHANHITRVTNINGPLPGGCSPRDIIARYRDHRSLLRIGVIPVAGVWPSSTWGTQPWPGGAAGIRSHGRQRPHIIPMGVIRSERLPARRRGGRAPVAVAGRLTISVGARQGRFAMANGRSALPPARSSGRYGSRR